MDIALIRELYNTYFESAERESAAALSIDKVTALIDTDIVREQINTAMNEGINLSAAMARYLVARQKADASFTKLRRVIGKIQFKATQEQ